MSSFTCYECEQVYDVRQDWTDEDAFKEAVDTLGVIAFEEKMVEVCDNCYQEALVYARENGLLK